MNADERPRRENEQEKGGGDPSQRLLRTVTSQRALLGAGCETKRLPVETLADVANDKEASASARVSAARSVVELAIKGAELQDLEERIGELEQLAMDKP